MAIYNGYKGAVSCTSGPTTGAKGLMAWFLAVYADDGGLNAGIYNCRNVRGGRTTSLHGEGRAADLAIRPYSAAYGTELANALRSKSKELGIQCIIWNRKIFSGGYKNKGWQKYNGSNAHVDHLHVELSWTSANRSAKDMIALLEKHIHIKGQTSEAKPQGNTSKPAPSNKKGWPYEPLKVDGIEGNDTITAMQTILASDAAGNQYTRKIDGKAGYWTWYGFQNWLKKLGYYQRTPLGVKLISDGKPGYWMNYELQRMLKDKNLYSGLLDGKRQSMTIKGFQKYANKQAKYYR